MVEFALSGERMGKLRRSCMHGLSGTVVEPGFGTGLNVAHYPNEVDRVYAVDPSIKSRDIAARRVASSRVDVEFVGLTGEQIPLDDNSCDAGLLTFTLCTIPDHMQALAELRRVIKPGGALHFLEHGLAEDPKVQIWQDRLTSIQRKIADGCHLNRPVLPDLGVAGFEIESSESRFVGRPHSFSWFSWGIARNPN